ncbi:hypothetical protein C8R43DRAFT_1012110 [Mycena crocata]|nr:hypothetical protein C8R43DRAFT_1012110 [Mycena crocata]
MEVVVSFLRYRLACLRRENSRKSPLFLVMFSTKAPILFFSPPLVTAEELSTKIDELLTLYPHDPVLGSPYNAGNETLKLDGGWKRMTSIVGDLSFQSTRMMSL